MANGATAPTTIHKGMLMNEKFKLLALQAKMATADFDAGSYYVATPDKMQMVKKDNSSPADKASVQMKTAMAKPMPHSQQRRKPQRAKARNHKGMDSAAAMK